MAIWVPDRLNLSEIQPRGLVFAGFPRVGELFASAARPTLMASGAFGSNAAGLTISSSSVTNGGAWWNHPATHPVYSLRTQITIVMVGAFGSFGAYGRLFEIPYAAVHAAPYAALCLNTDSTGLAGNLALGLSTNSTTNLGADSGAGFLLLDNKPHLYAAVRNGASVKFYRDGGAPTAVTGSLGANDVPDFTNRRPLVVLNHNHADPGEGAIGSCNVVLIFNRALADQEIQALYQDMGRYFAADLFGGSMYAPATTGSASITEASDTVAASGNIVILGAASITEGADTASGAGGIAIAGTAAITEAGDTAAATGVVVAVGSATITEGADTVAAVGVATVGATAAITEARDAVSASASAGSASASAAIVEGGDSVHAVGIGGQEAVIGAAGRDIYARWAKERRKLEKELREASEREIQELVEELEPVAPPKAKATLATLAEKAQAVRTVEARAQFQRAKAQYAKEIARLVVSAREAEEAKRRQEEDEDNWLFMLMHAA